MTWKEIALVSSVAILGASVIDALVRSSQPKCDAQQVIGAAKARCADHHGWLDVLSYDKARCVVREPGSVILLEDLP